MRTVKGILRVHFPRGVLENQSQGSTHHSELSLGFVGSLQRLLVHVELGFRIGILKMRNLGEVE